MKNLVWGLGILKPFTNHATQAYQALNIELLCPKKISEHDENLLDLAEVLELGAVVGEPDNSDSFQTRPVTTNLASCCASRVPASLSASLVTAATSSWVAVLW